jgi:hypothetical protein
MQKILKWFTPLIGVGVAIFIVFFLISINSDDYIIDSEPIVYESKVPKPAKEKDWIDHFSKTKRLGYFYPVNEVYIKLDLDEKITNTITYKLSAPFLDPYQIFCLKEELKLHKLKYQLKTDKHGLELLIFSKNIQRLNSLVKALKNYQIVAKIEPYKIEES